MEDKNQEGGWFLSWRADSLGEAAESRENDKRHDANNILRRNPNVTSLGQSLINKALVSLWWFCFLENAIVPCCFEDKSTRKERFKQHLLLILSSRSPLSIDAPFPHQEFPCLGTENDLFFSPALCEAVLPGVCSQSKVLTVKVTA